MGKKKRKNANNRFSPLAPTHTCQIPVTTLSRINLLEIENKAKDESIQRFQSEIREMERRCKDYEAKVNHLNDKLTFAAKTDPRMTAIQHPIPQTSSGIFLVPYSDLVARNRFLEDDTKEKDKLVKYFQNEIGKFQRKCDDYEGQVKHLKDKVFVAPSEKISLIAKVQKYEMQVTNLKDKLTIVGTEKHALLDKNRMYEKQATGLKEELKLLKKSSWVGVDDYAKMKIESLEKQVEEDVIKIQELKSKAQYDKVNKLKYLLEDKDKTIKIQKDKIANMSSKIDKQSDKIILQSKDLKTKDQIITKLRTEKKDDSNDIQLTEVIKEKEFIEVHTIVDDDECERDTVQNKYCERCQCSLNPEGIFESDLVMKMKTEDIKSEIKSEKF